MNKINEKIKPFLSGRGGERERERERDREREGERETEREREFVVSFLCVRRDGRGPYS